MSKITKDYDNTDVDQILGKLINLVQSGLPKHEIGAEVTTSKLFVTLEINGDFFQTTLNIARDVGLSISRDKKTISLTASGNDIKKIYNKIAGKWEIFYNSVQKRLGKTNAYIKVAKL